MNISLGDGLKIGGLLFAIGGWVYISDATHSAQADTDAEHSERIQRIEKATDAQQRENEARRDIRKRNQQLIRWCAQNNVPAHQCPLEEEP